MLVVFLFACQDSKSTDNTEQKNDALFSTEGVLTNINERVYNDDESVRTYSEFSWKENGSSRILEGNGIPNHEVGTFPNSGNPNSIRAQNVSENFTLYPSIESEDGVAVGGPAGAIAYAINSVKFDPATAGRCDDSGRCSLAQGQGCLLYTSDAADE